MTDSKSNSALVKPIRNIFKLFGAVFDAVYYFFDSLINPRSTYSRGRLTDSGRGPSGPRIGTLRPYGGNAPNMNIGGCRSCQM